MKKLFLVLTLLCMLFAFCACSNSGSSGGEIDLTKMSAEQLASLQSRVQQEISNRPDDHSVMINQALDVLKARWKEEYDQCGKPGLTFRLDIRGVRGSFVLTSYQGQIFVSARSIDEVNVQVIMERLGGGGHMNIAGCQLKDKTMDEAIALLKQTIDQMMEEGELA